MPLEFGKVNYCLITTSKGSDIFFLSQPTERAQVRTPGSFYFSKNRKSLCCHTQIRYTNIAWCGVKSQRCKSTISFGFRIGELPRLSDTGHYQPEAIWRKFADTFLLNLDHATQHGISQNARSPNLRSFMQAYNKHRWNDTVFHGALSKS